MPNANALIPFRPRFRAGLEPADSKSAFFLGGRLRGFQQRC